MSYGARPVENADESANPWGVGQQRAIVEKHDTPDSPHREHMQGGGAAEGRHGRFNEYGDSPEGHVTEFENEDLSSKELSLKVEALREEGGPDQSLLREAERELERRIKFDEGRPKSEQARPPTHNDREAGGPPFGRPGAMMPGWGERQRGMP